jgi:hypothetical protein
MMGRQDEPALLFISSASIGTSLQTTYSAKLMRCWT